MKDNIWKKYSDEDITKLNEICDEYRKFISESKIEREVTRNSIKIAEEYGFINLDKYMPSIICYWKRRYYKRNKYFRSPC